MKLQFNKGNIMKSILIIFMIVPALFAPVTVSAKEIPPGTVSQPLDWPSQAPLPVLTSQVTGGLALGCNFQSPLRYNCFNQYYISSDNRSATSHIYFQVVDRDPSKYLNTYNHTAQLITTFETGDFEGEESVIPGLVSGVIQSAGTLGTGLLSAEGWAAFGVKVEVYQSYTSNIENGFRIGGVSAVSEGCAATIPSGLELFEPCRNVFSNDVPVSIPIVLKENTQYFVVVTTSCDAQGVDVSCYGTEFAFDALDINSKGVRTVASDFVVSIGEQAMENSVSLGASQESVDVLQQSADDIQMDVGNIAAFSESSQAANQAMLDTLLMKVNSTLANVNALVSDVNATNASVAEMQAAINYLQSTVDNLQASVTETQNILENWEVNVSLLETGVADNKALIEANHLANQAKLDELIALVKKPLGHRKKH